MERFSPRDLPRDVRIVVLFVAPPVSLSVYHALYNPQLYLIPRSLRYRRCQ